MREGIIRKAWLVRHNLVSCWPRAGWERGWKDAAPVAFLALRVVPGTSLSVNRAQIGRNA